MPCLSDEAYYYCTRYLSFGRHPILLTVAVAIQYSSARTFFHFGR